MNGWTPASCKRTLFLTLWWSLVGRLVGTGSAQQLYTTRARDIADDFLQYIDPLIGTTNGGHVFPGATLPFGMAKAVADVNSGEAQGGYASDNSLSEFYR